MKVPFLDLRCPLGDLEPDLSAAVARVMDSGRYVLGPEVAAFEREFAAFCGTRCCVGVGSGLDALSLILRAWDIGPQDEVLVPAYTAVATWMAVTATGARPVGVDIDAEIRTIDPALIERAVTSRTKAIIPVHIFGVPADMEAVTSVAAEHGLPVLEDAAHAHGTRHRGRRAGGLGAAAGFSFYPTKNLGSLGDGGAVTTDDEELADRVRMMRDCGWRRHCGDSETEGFSSRLDEIQAAVLRVKLHRLEVWNERRAEIVDHYLTALADLESVGLPRIPDFAQPAWHLFVIAVEDRDEVQARLEMTGVSTRVHYEPLPHLTTNFRRAGSDEGSFPVAEHLAHRALSLPLYPHLPPEAAEEVVRAVRALSAASIGQPFTAT